MKKKEVTSLVKKVLRNPIEEYVHSNDEKITQTHKELFNADNDKVRTRTELDKREIRLIMRLIEIDNELERKGFKRVYQGITNTFMELQISKDRQSRKEYVEVNKKSQEDQLRQQLGGLVQQG